MNLAAHQQAFVGRLGAIDDGAVPESRGLQIYQNAYRERLLCALEAGFEQTRQWVGEDAFVAAARHYVMTHPPTSWTLDTYGADFPATLASLFAQDGEVAELAWLEWHLQQAFSAPDLPELSGADLAQAGLAEDEWEQLGFSMAAGFAAQPVAHDITGLWQALRGGTAADFALSPTEPGVLVVWRQTLTPHYRLLSEGEFAALDCLVQGGSFGTAAALCGADHAAALGLWLAQWLGEGLFAEFSAG